MTWFRPATRPPFHAAVEHGRPRLTLEISSRSSDRLGRDLSAMNLPAAGDLHGRPVEAVYQAAKCYGDGGPDTQLSQSGYEAKRRDRERRRQGPLAGFRHQGRQWPLETGSAFYDWLWTRSALRHCGHGVVERLQRYEGFTDQFHRPGALACQAKAAAIVAGMGLARARTAIETPEAWLTHLSGRAAPAPPEPPPAAPPSRVYAGIGSRQTPPAVLETMERIGRAMASHGWTLRSGAADGADTAFEAGAEHGKGPREIWLPWPGFNGRTADGAATRLGVNSQANRDLARQSHPAWHVLRDAVQKLMVRNVHQILGPEPGNSPPSDVVICWTPDGAGEGGTGMAIRLAERHGIPVVDLGTRELPRLERSLAAAHRRGMPDDVAAIVLEDTRARGPEPEAGAGSHRILVTGSLRAGETPILEAHLDAIAARRGPVALIAAGGSASRAALDWADRRGHATAAPPPRPAGQGRGERPLEYASRMLQAKPGTVVECGGDWNAYDQAVRDGAATARIRTERCPGLERTPTGVEHGLRQDEEERARKPAGQTGDEPPPEHRPRSRYDAVDRLVSGRLRLTEASGRIVRAAARRHQVVDPRTIERALFVTGSPKRDQLLGAAEWTTEDRQRHDPLGVLTGGASSQELDRTLRVARTIVTALTRAGLPAIAVRDIGPAAEGARPRDVATRRPSRPAPQPPL
ncbi:MAG: hypothetical protein OXF93_17430 [Acidobacteria bacterium]|nr:hypothetical protein [Acidobacteriota bacterium]